MLMAPKPISVGEEIIVLRVTVVPGAPNMTIPPSVGELILQDGQRRYDSDIWAIRTVLSATVD
jgi:hypothetical protein